MIRAMQNKDNGSIKREIREEIRNLAHAFPIPDSFI